MIALLRGLSLTGWLILLGGIAAYSGGLYVLGRWHASTNCELRELRTEAKADGRADKVTADADKRGDKIRAKTRTDTEESADEARAIVESLPAGCPAQPDRLRDIGREAVEAAGREVLPAS